MPRRPEITLRGVSGRRLVWKIYNDEVIASHVLTMLGGPMEQMESWGPPGSNKRRPCRVMVTTALWESGTSLSVRKMPVPMLLGIPENYHATD